VGGVAAEDVDILYFDGANWFMLFDASDVGVAASAQNLDGFYFLDADTILMSFDRPLTLGSLAVDEFDIVQFDATALGDNTAGSFSMYFDSIASAGDTLLRDVALRLLATFLGVALETNITWRRTKRNS
jgi:hypothetical protein